MKARWPRAFENNYSAGSSLWTSIDDFLLNEPNGSEVFARASIPRRRINCERRGKTEREGSRNNELIEFSRSSGECGAEEGRPEGRIEATLKTRHFANLISFPGFISSERSQVSVEYRRRPGDFHSRHKPPAKRLKPAALSLGNLHARRRFDLARVADQLRRTEFHQFSLFHGPPPAENLHCC